MVILFAGVKGFIDRVDVSKVTAFEKAWLNHIKTSHKASLSQAHTEIISQSVKRSWAGAIQSPAC